MMLERSGLEHEVRELPPGLHPPLVRAAGFPGWTVPALRIDGSRIQGTRTIARELHERAPEAGIFPAEEAARRAVEEAERWGHDELQPLPRRIFRWAGANSSAVRTWMAREVNGLPAPSAFGAALKPAMTFFARRVSGADDAAVRADLARLPELLDRADALVEEGTVGGAVPNAADLQILTSLRLLLLHEDLRPRIEDRPSAQAALRMLPDYPRPGPDALPPAPAAFPEEWLRAAGRRRPDAGVGS